ncbi:MAG TPA: hypothetical protein VFA55_06145 [Candidatus Kapabacteria bacterium]|nr:hypothetical protein [Candidatus Kapabacteria bacterium]
MSHYTCYVITEHGTEEEAEYLLAPFNEDAKALPYKRACDCVGRRAQTRVDTMVDAKYPLKGLREKFHERYPNESEERLQILWEREIFPRRSYEKELLSRQKDRNKPDRNCRECNGTGLRESTRNPRAKWDWYAFGGRWKRVFKDNAIKAKTLVERLSEGKDAPYSFITPDGVWHAKGEMGWWGISHGDKEEREWLDECRAVFAQYPKHTVLLYDLHI